jgi:hypothetical protein
MNLEEEELDNILLEEEPKEFLAETKNLDLQPN